VLYCINSLANSPIFSKKKPPSALKEKDKATKSLLIFPNIYDNTE